MSIRYKLLLAAGIPVVLLWVVGRRADGVLAEALDQQAERSLAGAARVAADDLASWFEDLVAYWRAWAESPAVRAELEASNARFRALPGRQAMIAQRDEQWRAGARDAPWALAIQHGALSRDLRRAQRLASRDGRTLFPEVFLTNAFGSNVAQTDWTTDYRQDDEEWWRRARDAGIGVEPVRFDHSAKSRSVAVCLRIDDDKGRLAGVLKAVLDFERILTGLTARAEKLGARLLLEREDGRVFFATSAAAPGDPGPGLNEALAALPRRGGLPRWRVRIQQSTQRALAAVAGGRQALLWICGAATLAALVFAGWGMAQISLRVTRLARGVERLARGELSVRIDERGRDELSVLARGLNDMARSLDRAREDLARQNEKLLEEVEERQRIQERQRAILDSAYEAFVATNQDGLVTEWNYRAEILFGWTREEALGTSLEELIVPPGQRGRPLDGLMNFMTLRESQKPCLPSEWTEFECVRKDGGRIMVRALTWPSFADTEVSFNAFLMDITDELREREERARLEAQILQSSKLEAIGQLAAGIAHEINTPTQYIGDNTRFLQDAFRDLARILSRVRALAQDPDAGLPEGLTAELRTLLEDADVDYLEEEVPRAIAQALEGVQRVAEIVAAMKNFSHSGARADMEPVDLNEGIRSTVTVARNEWKYVADVELDLDPDLPLVQCQAGAINQVVLNLVVNAAHAIAAALDPDSGEKGRIVVSTRLDGDHVEIRVRDNGTGIPEEVRDRIFEPFFTTKEVGKGTGQGLSIAHDVVVNKHGGSLSFETELGRGTTFCIRIPVAREAPQEEAQGATQEVSA